MNDDIKLECTQCGQPTEWTREKENVVRCNECSKIHSDESLAPVWGMLRTEYL